MSNINIPPQGHITAATLAKLSKNEPVAMKVIEDTLLYTMQEEKRIRPKGGIYHQTQIKLAYNSNHYRGQPINGGADAVYL